MLFRTLRVALVATLSLSLLSVRAQNKAPRSETYKDIIEKAYNLGLQKDRQQAINILVAALPRENRPAAVAEIRKTISEISHIFFSDKAQQLFEAGVSLRRTDLGQSFDKIVEASRVEPDNFLIVNELARVMVARGDCRNAQETVQKQLLLVKFDEDLKLTLAQTLGCQGKWAEYQKLAEGLQIKKSPQYKFWAALEVEKSLTPKTLSKAQESLANLKKADDKYPESFYWAWKLSQTQKKPLIDEAQKYIASCKNISANQYRQYMIDPMLCRRVSDVESELKGMNGTVEP